MRHSFIGSQEIRINHSTLFNIRSEIVLFFILIYLKTSIWNISVPIGHDELSQATYNQQLTRLKSKSQIDLNSDTSNHLTKRSVHNEEDDLRSLQRQLQNFPSLNELKSNLLTPWGPQTNSSLAKVNETRDSIRLTGPFSRRENLDNNHSLSSNINQDKTDDTETFALLILHLLKVCIALMNSL